MNLLEVNIEQGFILFACFKNVYILKYDRNKRSKEKVFGKKNILVTVNGSINQIKMITMKQKYKQNIPDYYDKENNIFYTDLKEYYKSDSEGNLTSENFVKGNNLRFNLEIKTSISITEIFLLINKFRILLSLYC